MKPKVFASNLIAAAVLSALGAGVFSAGHWFPQEAKAATGPAGRCMAPAAGTLLPDFTGIVARNGPAVVNISVTHEAKAGANAQQSQGMDPNNPVVPILPPVSRRRAARL